MLINFLRIVKQLFRMIKITNNKQKLNWFTSYTNVNITN